MIGPKQKIGHPVIDWRREFYMRQFGLSYVNPSRDLTDALLDQLE